MPWCAGCEKYFAPSALTTEGHCPRCDADLEAPEAPRRSVATTGGGVPGDDTAPADADSADDDEGVPWHFKLMVVLLVVYLGWRFVQLVTGQL